MTGKRLNEGFILRDVNSSKVYTTGSKWKTNSYGFVTVLGQGTEYRERNGWKEHNRFIVQFDDGTVLKTTARHLSDGGIRNPNAPNVYGRGYIGVGPHLSSIGSKDTKEYKAWHGMMERCYSEKNLEKFPTYIGCSVDERWWNFQNFCEDIQHLEGYDEWKNNTKVRAWDLDKDIKVKGNKIYSKDTCMFVPHAVNIAFSNLTGNTYQATRISDNKKVIFKSIVEFIEEYGISRSNISSCFNGYRKSTQGWKFKVVK